MGDRRQFAIDLAVAATLAGLVTIVVAAAVMVMVGAGWGDVRVLAGAVVVCALAVMAGLLAVLGAAWVVQGRIDTDVDRHCQEQTAGLGSQLIVQVLPSAEQRADAERLRIARAAAARADRAALRSAAAPFEGDVLAYLPVPGAPAAPELVTAYVPMVRRRAAGPRRRRP